MVYQPGIPTGTVYLDQDYLNIQGNFQQLDTSFGIDHLPFSNTSGQNGYHTSIHFNPQSTGVPNYPPTVPATTPGYGQVFAVTDTDGISADTQLYWLSGAGNLAALTRNFQPKQANNGYTFLPGGLILQWGVTAIAPLATVPIVFATANKTFPVSIFNVQVTPIRPAGGSFTTNFSVTNVTTAGFTIVNGDGTGTALGFYWQAIGN